MRKIYTAIGVLVCSASLVGCENMNKQDVGTITGGVAGGLLSSTVGQGNGRVLAIAAGTLAGAFVGNAIGQSMDETDRMKMNSALENNNVGQPAYWKNGQTGATYKVTPTRNVKVKSNPYCREYRTTAEIAGKTQQMYGTACRQPDGTWKMVK